MRPANQRAPQGRTDKYVTIRPEQVIKLLFFLYNKNPRFMQGSSFIYLVTAADFDFLGFGFGCLWQGYGQNAIF